MVAVVTAGVAEGGEIIGTRVMEEDDGETGAGEEAGADVSLFTCTSSLMLYCKFLIECKEIISVLNDKRCLLQILKSFIFLTDLN